MERERLFQFFETHYVPKSGVLPRLPLGTDPDEIWREIINRRRAKGIMLPLHGPTGSSYWYVITGKMISASEKIVEELLEYEAPGKPVPIAPLEEIFYTSYVEGSQITMKDAMEFLQAESEPRDIEEQMIINNRKAAGFANANLYQPMEEHFIKTLSMILTENMDGGGGEYRVSDLVEIPSMAGEKYELPKAVAIPDRMREFTVFLSDPGIHPLIKAGATQGFLLACRPFGEGDERLARLLSSMILHRAGYTFFGEVSLSSLLAKNGYPYYDAVANILKQENGGDLTYFLEYYLRLISQAVDVRRKRVEEQVMITIDSEQAMAKEVLGPSINDEDLDGFINMMEGGEERTAPVEGRKEVYDSGKDGIHTGEASTQGGGEVRAHWAGELQFKNRAYQVINTRKTVTAECLRILIRYIDEGRTIFDCYEVGVDMGIRPRSVASYLGKIKGYGLIKTIYKNETKQTYTYAVGNDPLTDEAYDRKYISVLQDLMAQPHSQKDHRLGEKLMNALPNGFITEDIYIQSGDKTRWKSDMDLAEQMGLVTKLTDDFYSLNREPVPRLDKLNESQKRNMTKMYEIFGEETFTLEMVVATLSYDQATASAYLHRFQLLKILDCRKEDVFYYQFLVNPRENPECFLTEVA